MNLPVFGLIGYFNPSPFKGDGHAHNNGLSPNTEHIFL